MTDDDILQEIVRRLVEAVHPTCIILYGSRARGDAGPDSDFDILIIAPLEGPRWQRITELHRLLDDLGVFEDIVWYEAREVEEWREVYSHFTTTILREGKVLYGNRARAAETPPPAKTPLDYALTWLEKAARQLEASELFLRTDGELYGAVCLHAHEAAEMSVKAILALDDVFYSKTHQLRRLLDLAIPRVPQLSQMEDLLLALSPFALDVRDDLAEEPYEPTARAAVDTARKCYDLAARIIQERQ